MRLTVKNLGVISKASVDLSKDLIILTGENNTGKTYLAYAVYGLSNVEYLPGANKLPKYDQETPGKVTINLSDVYSKSTYLEEFKNRFLEEKLNESVSKIFAMDPDDFEGFDAEIQFLPNDYSEKRVAQLEIDRQWTTKPSSTEAFVNKVSKAKNNPVVEFETENEDYLNMLVYNELRRITLRQVLPTAVIIPAERTGINLFHKELSIIKNKVFDSFLTNGNQYEMYEFLKTRFNRYSFPIQEALHTAQNLDAIQKKQSDFRHLAKLLEEDFLQSELRVSEDGDIRFIPKGTSKALDMQVMSSSVKSLASLVFYLRHLAQKNDFIIIDEPEANLHPNNQIKIARFLARLVNEGFKVMISTHSDYIMRELNSLIMLGSGKKNELEKTKALLKKFKEYNENQFLDKEQVGVYLFRQGKDVEELKVEDTGFEIATIDETVDRLNETSQNIYYELFD